MLRFCFAYNKIPCIWAYSYKKEGVFTDDRTGYNKAPA